MLRGLPARGFALQPASCRNLLIGGVNGFAMNVKLARKGARSGKTHAGRKLSSGVVARHHIDNRHKNRARTYWVQLKLNRLARHIASKQAYQIY